MAIENLNVERGGGYDVLRFSCSARQIQIVKQQLIPVPKPAVDRAKPKKKQPLQETKPVPKEQAEAIQKDRSLLFSLGKKLLGD